MQVQVASDELGVQYTSSSLQLVKATLFLEPPPVLCSDSEAAASYSIGAQVILSRFSGPGLEWSCMESGIPKSTWRSCALLQLEL